MITQSGVHIQKIDGVQGTPTVADIAVHAGRICRFGGAIWYPLLPHLVFVGLLAYRRSNRLTDLLWGFLHDAHEIATSDVPRPFKCDCMRVEQRAIDARIYEMFYAGPFTPDPINKTLIQECDIDACDIEAMTLKLPGYAQVVKDHGRSYGKYQAGLHENADDQVLFNRVIASPFFTDTLHGMESEGVCLFIEALNLAQVGNYGDFLSQVKSWNLL